MISLAIHSQTEQGCFTLILEVIWRHFTSMIIRKNQIHFFYTNLLSFIYKLSTIMRILERNVLQVLPGIWSVCYGAALNYPSMYNGIKDELH